MRRFLSLLIVLLAAMSWGCKAKKDSPVIKIGVIGPMKFVQGKGHWNGALMAQKEINDAGGIKVGDKMKKIELVQADSNEFLSMTDATNAMDRLVNQDKVDFIVGGFRTEAVLAMQEIAMDAKIIFIGNGAADFELCERVGKNYNRYKYFFRGTPFNNRYLGKTCFIHLATVAAILKQSLNIPKVKVAIVAEKAKWVEAMVGAAKDTIPKMGMELVGIWQPSQTATDVNAELSAIQRSGAHIIFTVFSSSVGITFARQVGELKIPAVQVGINVEAQKEGFWQATEKKGDYVMTMNTYARDVEYNELTKPFVDTYIKMFNEVPTYTADTYTAIKYPIKQSIEKAGTIESDKLVPIIETLVYKASSGTIKLDKNHDLEWGPGYLTSLGVQWQNGKLVAVWPNKWKATPEAPEITYKGIVPFKIPPSMMAKYKK